MTSPTSDTPPADICDSCGESLDAFGQCDNLQCDNYEEPEDLDVEEEDEDDEDALDDDEEEPVV